MGVGTWGDYATFAGSRRGMTRQPLIPDAHQSSCESLQPDPALQQQLVAHGGEKQVIFARRLYRFNS